MLSSGLGAQELPPAPAPIPAASVAAPTNPPPVVPAVDPAVENQAFESSLKAFQDRNHPTAERFFEEFRQRFPQSARLPEAVLLQARAMIEQTKLDPSLQLLEGHVAKAGGVADEYHYWMGEVKHRKGDYRGAAHQFALLLAKHPTSARRLEASFSEARSHFKLAEWTRTVDLLKNPAGSFRTSAQARNADNLVTLGELMLVEAQVQLREFGSAEETARRLDQRALTPDMRWRKDKLLCELLLEGGKPGEALIQSTNAIQSASSTGGAEAVADAIDLQATVLSRLNRLADAARVYELNLTEQTPVARQKDALLQLIQIHLAQNEFQLATQRLDLLLARSPSGSQNDAALMTYGEVYLRAYGQSLEGGTPASAATRTNLVAEAVARFDQVLRIQPPSPLAGRAHLNRGWGYWAQGRWLECQEAFRNAAATLPYSEEKAVAQFKLAEAQARLGENTNAIASFQDFTLRFASLPRVANTLMDQALLQLVRLHFETKNIDAAQTALTRLLAWKPESSLVDSSLLFMGTRLTLMDEPELARGWLEKVPESSQAKPVAELAIARAYSQQGQWTNALQAYSRWLERFPQDSELRPKAEFNLAWTAFQTGAESNAYALFTNFVARHPTDTLAPMAEFWIGDHYYRQQNFTNAEIQFRRIYQNTNWPVSELSYEAKMQEGRAAFARQGFNNAQELFTQILNDKPPYPDLVARAFFAFGDCLMMQAAISTNAFARYEEASKAFRNITILHATNAVAPKAWGNLGNCYLQLAQQEPDYYLQATNAYQQVLNHPQATVADRSQAEIGLALALKKRAETFTTPRDKNPLFARAQFHLHRVLYEKNLWPGEQPDPFWQKKAGLESGQLAETVQDWSAAIGVYERLRQLLPQLAPDLDRRIARARTSRPSISQ